MLDMELILVQLIIILAFTQLKLTGGIKIEQPADFSSQSSPVSAASTSTKGQSSRLTELPEAVAELVKSQPNLQSIGTTLGSTQKPPLDWSTVRDINHEHDSIRYLQEV